MLPGLDQLKKAAEAAQNTKEFWIKAKPHVITLLDSFVGNASPANEEARSEACAGLRDLLNEV
jgi:hypothetical protein